jgi:hypothetical protein
MTGRVGKVQGLPLHERPRPRRLCERPGDAAGGDRGNGCGGSVAVLVALVLVATVSEATAQGRVGINGYGILGDVRLDAAQTFEAVAETSHARVFGGGVQVTDSGDSYSSMSPSRVRQSTVGGSLLTTAPSIGLEFRSRSACYMSTWPPVGDTCMAAYRRTSAVDFHD